MFCGRFYLLLCNARLGASALIVIVHRLRTLKFISAVTAVVKVIQFAISQSFQFASSVAIVEHDTVSSGT